MRGGVVGVSVLKKVITTRFFTAFDALLVVTGTFEGSNLKHRLKGVRWAFYFKNK